jgi:hypothetical protein
MGNPLAGSSCAIMGASRGCQPWPAPCCWLHWLSSFTSRTPSGTSRVIRQLAFLEIEERTPFWSYLTHWGLFLFVIVSWLFWETWDWLDKTPLSHARRYRWMDQRLPGLSFDCCSSPVDFAG